MHHLAHRFAFGTLIFLALAHRIHAQTLTYDVEIVFTGMTTLSLQVDPQNGTGPIDVIIMNARELRPSRSGDPHDIHEHIPYILSAGLYFETVDNPGIELKNAPNQPEKFQYTELLGETITINPFNIDQLNTSLTYTTDGTECPTAMTKTSLRWLPSMRTITQNTALLKDSDYFSPAPSPRFVAGRMLLDVGKLETAVIHLRKYNFKKRRSDTTVSHSQAIAQEAILRLKAIGDPFILNLRSFDGARKRRLIFRPDMTQKKLVIVIANTTLPEIGPLPNADSAPAIDHDPHFPLYYEFVDCNPHETGPVPFDAGPGNACTDASALTKTVWTRNPVPSTLQKRPGTPSGSPSAGGGNCGPDQWP